MQVDQQVLDSCFKEALGNQAVTIAKLNAAYQTLVRENASLTGKLAAATKELEELKKPKPVPHAIPPRALEDDASDAKERTA